MKQLVMKEGQWLTHEDGTRYAKALRDIPYHSVISSKAFQMADGSKPEAYSSIPDDVIKMARTGYVHQVCVDGKWKQLKQDVSEPFQPTDV